MLFNRQDTIHYFNGKAASKTEAAFSIMQIAHLPLP